MPSDQTPPLVPTSPPPPLGAPAPSKSGPSAAVVLSIIGGIIVLLVAVSLGIGYSYSNRFGDLDAPPDETGFEPFTERVPDDENAYVYLKKAVEALDLDADYMDRYDDEDPEDARESPLLGEIETAYEDVIALYEKALAAPRCVSPRAATLDDYPFPSADEFEELEELMRVRIRLRFYMGDEGRALRDALEYAGLGLRLMDSHGPPLVYHEGVNLTRSGMNQLQWMIPQSTLPASRLAALQEDLWDMYDAGTMYRASLVEAYRIVPNTIRILLAQEDLIAPNNGAKRDRTTDYAGYSHFWQPNRTRSVLLDTLRPLSNTADRPYAEVPLDVIPESFEGSEVADIVFSTAMPNGLSNMFVRDYLCKMEETIIARVLHNTEVSLAIATIAIARHCREQGELPESLDVLVPSYLGAVPRDDFSGAPLRYDRETAVVYSVGVNLVDDGGAPRENDSDLDDIFVDLWEFSPEAQKSE